MPSDFDSPFMVRVHGDTHLGGAQSADDARRRLVLDFLQERCVFNRGAYQPMRALGQEWQAWLLLQGAPSLWRQALSARWLKLFMTEQMGYREAQQAGYHGIVGVELKTAKGPSPLVASVQQAHNLSTVPPTVAHLIPLAGATALKRPPDSEIAQRFLDDCCVVEEKPAKEQRAVGWATGASVYKRWSHDSFTRVARAFAWWLEEKQKAAPSLRVLCSSQWLRGQLKHQIGCEFRYASGDFLSIYGVILKPEYAWIERWKHIRRDDSGAVLPPKTPVSELTARRRAYEDRLEQRARQIAGMPPQVVEGVEALGDSGLAGRTDVPSRPSSILEHSSPPLEEETAQARHERASALANAYLDDALIAEPRSSLPLRKIQLGFAAYLTNRGLRGFSDSSVGIALRSVLRERGMGAGQKRLRTISGYRFRTPDDPPL